MAPVVGYWDIRGISEPVRMILHHIGIDFEDKRYDITKNDWLDEKETLGLEFPNLPYFIDGDVRISQSLVIVRYLAHKHGLVPNSEQGKIKAGTLEQISRDVLDDITRHSYYPPLDNKEFQTLMENRILDVVKRLSDNLGENQWFVENKLTYADFLIVESIDQLSYIHPRILKDHPNISAIIKRLYDLPNIEKYMQGSKYRAWPLCTPTAHWGGSGEAPSREC